MSTLSKHAEYVLTLIIERSFDGLHYWMYADLIIPEGSLV